MPKQTMSQRYWGWSQEKRDAHNAYMREYHRAHKKPAKPRIARSNTGNTFNYNVKNYIDSVKVQIGKCADCELPCQDWNVVMFAFDHLDPATKSFNLSKAQGQKGCNPVLIDNEIAKCELVCHNCHAYRTWVTRAHVHSNKPKAVRELPLLALMYNDN